MRVFKHPEQMTPGSLWKIKGMKGLCRIVGKQAAYNKYRNWSTYTFVAGRFQVVVEPSLALDLDQIYMLVSFECSEHGLIKAGLLTQTNVVYCTMYETTWDKSLRLTKKAGKPKRVEKLLFDRYDVEVLKRKLGLE